MIIRVQPSGFASARPRCPHCRPRRAATHDELGLPFELLARALCDHSRNGVSTTGSLRHR